MTDFDDLIKNLDISYDKATGVGDLNPVQIIETEEDARMALVNMWPQTIEVLDDESGNVLIRSNEPTWDSMISDEWHPINPGARNAYKPEPEVVRKKRVSRKRNSVPPVPDVRSGESSGRVANEPNPLFGDS